MKTYLRWSIFVLSKTYPYKAPEHIQKEADELKKCMSEYYAKDENYYIPIDTEAYSQIMRFIEKNDEYISKTYFYVNEYTKQEMVEAEYFNLKCTTLIENDYNYLTAFEYPCEHCKIQGKQLENYTVKKNGLGNRLMAFSYDYRFIISTALKEKLESENISNARFIPVYDKRHTGIEGYQFDAEQPLKSLSKKNGWEPYFTCQHCNRSQYSGVQHTPHPFYIPKEWKSELKDVNATSDVFTETNANYIIISRKVYDILKEMGTKKLDCEPVVFV